MNQVFIGGPKAGTYESYPSPVPPKVVSVYREEVGMLCSDEQVTKRLGRYVRQDRPIVERGKPTGKYVYYWEPEDG